MFIINFNRFPWIFIEIVADIPREIPQGILSEMPIRIPLEILPDIFLNLKHFFKISNKVHFRKSFTDSFAVLVLGCFSPCRGPN